MKGAYLYCLLTSRGVHEKHEDCEHINNFKMSVASHFQYKIRNYLSN